MASTRPTKRTTVAAKKSRKPADTKVGKTPAMAPVLAPGSPKTFRARVRMYRHGLGDCFLLTFPRKGTTSFQVLIDCGALARDRAFMTRIVEHIRDTVRDGKNGKARLDVVVGTHEHKDHVSGFNQARQVFNDDIEFGSVWLSWAENLSQREIQKIKDTKKKAVEKLQGMAGMASLADREATQMVKGLLSFSEDDPQTGRVSDAMDYLKKRGKDAGDLRYLEPGGEPFDLDGLDDVRVYVLGPPKDPSMLKTSAVTQAMKREDAVYHLASTGDIGMEALGAALQTGPSAMGDRYHPFAAEHRITARIQDPLSQKLRANPRFERITSFLKSTYDDPAQKWRRVDDDWLSSFGQLALDLDNDTNNTSLVLAFEFKKTREVLLFVADAQIGSWLSWADLEFKVPGQSRPVVAPDLLGRTVFYKVGHHCSHNATAKAVGLELMTRDDLVAFIPLDKKTAASQGKKGWEMPAPPLFKALNKRAGKRVVISDVNETVTTEAKSAGVIATESYIDYFLR